MAIEEHGSRWAVLKQSTGAGTGGEPLGAHWDHRVAARDTAGGPGWRESPCSGSSLTAAVDAAAFSNVDKQKLVALVQSRPSSNDDDDELSAVVVACKSHSSNIVDVLIDLLDRAQTELDDTRHAESNAAHNFSMLQQSLEDQLAQLNRALKKAKADEYTTSLDVENAESQAASKTSCVQVASEHEALVKGFAEEMKALADATQVLQSESSGAEGS